MSRDRQPTILCLRLNRLSPSTLVGCACPPQILTRALSPIPDIAASSMAGSSISSYCRVTVGWAWLGPQDRPNETNEDGELNNVNSEGGKEGSGAGRWDTCSTRFPDGMECLTNVAVTRQRIFLHIRGCPDAETIVCKVC